MTYNKQQKSESLSLKEYVLILAVLVLIGGILTYFCYTNEVWNIGWYYAQIFLYTGVIYILAVGIKQVIQSRFGERKGSFVTVIVFLVAFILSLSLYLHMRGDYLSFIDELINRVLLWCAIMFAIYAVWIIADMIISMVKRR